MDIVERIIVYRDRSGRSLEGREMLADAANEIDKLRGALQRIEQWSDAYPLDMFPEPDLKKAAEVLKANGMTLDAISASCMRHVVEGVGKIAREALELRNLPALGVENNRQQDSGSSQGKQGGPANEG
jgi:hypothetical protein